jgi:alpha-N-acetylglucosaminidase
VKPHIAVIITFACHCTAAYGNEIIDAAEKVLTRQFGHEVPPVQWEMISAMDGRDIYETVCTEGTLRIRGSSTMALCRGFHDYLRANHLGMVGWEGPRVKIPSKWPDAPLIHVESPFKWRHCYNAVTAAYTTPYWTWKRWEQELDWLAMHGYNMIMAPVAYEAIATRVWKKMGFSQEEIDGFYVGPAHLPFHRMGLLQKVGGTLPQDWHRDQLSMQHKILDRMRELGIEPVVQGFAGCVPDQIKRLHPEAKVMETLWNDGFGRHQRPQLLLPDQPLFKEISRAHIEEWRREFGEAKYYLVDSFNELKNIKPDAEKFREFGKKTIEAVRAGDPDGVWVVQGWIFSYQRDIWTKENVKAFFEEVPDEQVLILDYANDYKRGWDYFEGFFGKPYVMGYVPNMGGKTAFTGRLDRYATGVEEMLRSEFHKTCVGFTISGEGLENNQLLYELLSDTAWSRSRIHLDSWFEKYSRARYENRYPEEIKTAWDLLQKTCYGSFTPHPRFGWQTVRCAYGSVNRSPEFTQGVQSFLACRDDFKDSASYQDDALEMSAISLSLKAEDWFVAAIQCHASGDMKGMDQAAARGLQLLLEADRLLESHSLHRLDRWIDLARQHSADEKLNDFYEENARRILTVWGPPVDDYACRMWSGLIRDYYQPRMASFLESLKGKPFDRQQWEESWVRSTGVSKIKPYRDPIATAAQLVKDAYAEEVLNSGSLIEGDLLGNWTPSQMSDTWRTIRWPLSAKQLKNFKGVWFLFQATVRSDAGTDSFGQVQIIK